MSSQSVKALKQRWDSFGKEFFRDGTGTRQAENGGLRSGLETIYRAV